MNENMWFNIGGIVTYWMQRGQRILIELCEGSDIPMAKQYLLGSCLGMIMLQRNMIAIHGGQLLLMEKVLFLLGIVELENQRLHHLFV